MFFSLDASLQRKQVMVGFDQQTSKDYENWIKKKSFFRVGIGQLF
jgi:hypothetical protein